jgi:hypothetical protein
MMDANCCAGSVVAAVAEEPWERSGAGARGRSSSGTATAARRRRPPSPRGSRPGGDVRGCREALLERDRGDERLALRGLELLLERSGLLLSPLELRLGCSLERLELLGLRLQLCDASLWFCLARFSHSRALAFQSTEVSSVADWSSVAVASAWSVAVLSVSGMVMHPPCGWFGRAVRLRCPRICGTFVVAPSKTFRHSRSDGRGRARASGRGTGGSSRGRQRASRRRRTRGPRRSDSCCGT